ncbi:MAG: hypothetical protein COT34_00315 [Candidatus Nealsonbacteria bacterium CG08_land_8_20_14_0_20_43_11]|uniref:Uncharacterized protein n=1 Tax=Candidatus Nealsonbacteria bacterium CG08_land_8_20_14_0_20_43_11 TaxID=1974706 RepID=A0A2M6T170_9BACT|nr:MAG: hypothetical protein COT34_00315 [Candidatus Nealsonbacteria bacterium CG08_land_8_20_14_0_20_43_11]
MVCFANGKIKTLLITAKEKRKALLAMRAIDKPKRTFVFRIFAGLIFLLVQDEDIETIVIDEEYPEHEATIKFILLTLFQKFHKKSPEIDFQRIGKKSMAHIKGIAVFRGETKPDIVVKAKDLFGLFN